MSLHKRLLSIACIAFFVAIFIQVPALKSGNAEELLPDHNNQALISIRLPSSFEGRDIVKDLYSLKKSFENQDFFMEIDVTVNSDKTHVSFDFGFINRSDLHKEGMPPVVVVKHFSCFILPIMPMERYKEIVIVRTLNVETEPSNCSRVSERLKKTVNELLFSLIVR